MNEHDILLGVNIDHVATIRQSRGTRYPDPLEAAFLAERAGADAITIHLREDRRHIQPRDVELLLASVNTRVNLELAVEEDVLQRACAWRPQDICLVPEKRQELTTEGGLDVAGETERIADACARLQEVGCRVSLFIDPELKQIDAARNVGASVVELHTGAFAEAATPASVAMELARIVTAARHAAKAGLQVNAGHGLHYHNVTRIAAITEIRELNIGHAIVARAIMSGLPAAVTDMKKLMLGARCSAC